MVLIELKVKRYNEKVKGICSFVTKVEGREFAYLETSRVGSTETWENNFSNAYILRRKDKDQKIVLFSISGVSTFNENWEERKDFPLDRAGEEYRALEKSAKKGDLEKLESAFEKFVLD